jgi:hypothetical protein
MGGSGLAAALLAAKVRDTLDLTPWLPSAHRAPAFSIVAPLAPPPPLPPPGAAPPPPRASAEAAAAASLAAYALRPTPSDVALGLAACALERGPILRAGVGVLLADDVDGPNGSLRRARAATAYTALPPGMRALALPASAALAGEHGWGGSAPQGYGVVSINSLALPTLPPDAVPGAPPSAAALRRAALRPHDYCARVLHTPVEPDAHAVAAAASERAAAALGSRGAAPPRLLPPAGPEAHPRRIPRAGEGDAPPAALARTGVRIMQSRGGTPGAAGGTCGSGGGGREDEQAEETEEGQEEGCANPWEADAGERHTLTSAGTQAACLSLTLHTLRPLTAPTEAARERTLAAMWGQEHPRRVRAGVARGPAPGSRAGTANTAASGASAWQVSSRGPTRAAAAPDVTRVAAAALLELPACAEHTVIVLSAHSAAAAATAALADAPADVAARTRSEAVAARAAVDVATLHRNTWQPLAQGRRGGPQPALSAPVHAPRRHHPHDVACRLGV